MAGIQAVDSSGKTVLSLLNIGKMIQSGQSAQARNGVEELRNELLKHKLSLSNRELQQKSSALNKAISELNTAKQKVGTLTMENFEDRRKADKVLADEKLGNIKSEADLELSHIQSEADLEVSHIREQDKLARENFKDKWENEEERAQAARRKAIIERVEGMIDKGEEVPLRDLSLYYAAVAGASDINYADFEKGAQTLRENRAIDTEVKRLRSIENPTALQTAQLHIYKAAQSGILDDLDPATLSEQFGYLVTQEQIRGFMAEADSLRKEASQMLRPREQSVPEPSLSESRRNAAEAGGIEIEQATTPGAVATDEYREHLDAQQRQPSTQTQATVSPAQEALAAHFRQGAAKAEAIAEAMRLGLGDSELREQMHKEGLAAEEQETQRFVSLPDEMKVVERLQRQAASPNATPEDRKNLKDAVRNLVDKPLLGNDFVTVMEYVKNQQQAAQRVLSDPRATETQKQAATANLTLWTLAEERYLREGVPSGKAQTSSTSSTSRTSRKAEDAPLDAAPIDTTEYDKAVQRGSFETPYDKINANPHINWLKLPTGFTIKNNTFVWDKHVGVRFARGNPTEMAKSLPFSIDFMNQLTTQLRSQGYTPKHMQSVIRELKALSSELGATGGPIPKGAVGNPNAQLVWTFGNISAIHGDVIRAFEKQLTKHAGTQKTRLEQLEDSGLTVDEQKVEVWRGFGNWSTGLLASTEPTPDGSQTQARTENGRPQPIGSSDLVSGGTIRMFDRKTNQFTDLPIDRVIKDASGKITHIVSNGQRWIAYRSRQGDRPITHIYPEGQSSKLAQSVIPGRANVALPSGTARRRVFQRMRPGTPLIINGTTYYFSKYVKGKIEVSDEDSNLRVFSAHPHKPIFLPGRLPTQHINAYLSGRADTSSGAKRMFESGKKTPYTPMTPDANKSRTPANRAQKKNNRPVTGSTAASMTWETLKDGRRVVRLDERGRALATVLNLVKPGETQWRTTRDGKRIRTPSSKPGVRDADTIGGISVELPDINNDGLPDEIVELADGRRVRLGEVWKSEQFEPGQGAVYTKDTDIRLAGFWAEEMVLSDKKTLNPLGVRAQEALLKMFQHGWRDAKENNRFIFKVRVAGTPTAHKPLVGRNKKYANPYHDRFNRIVTDVYVVIGGTEKKIAELTWANVAERMRNKGLGEIRTPWRLK